MTYRCIGKILQGVGGRYTIALSGSADCPTPLDGQTVFCRARGSFRHDGIIPLPGDDVVVTYDDTALRSDAQGMSAAPDGSGIRIDTILPRRNALIRPPMANLDVLFVTLAVASPTPLLPVVDKLLSIAEFHAIEPVLIVGKSDLDADRADELATLYRNAGFTVFTVSCERNEGIDAVSNYINTHLSGKIAAFSGASGVGKSTLLNHLFPTLSQLTGEVSAKNLRGRNTTREVTLFPLPAENGGGYIADTPGFSLLDFTRFDFFSKDDLPETMREFLPYLGQCRYSSCTHTKEEGCAILEAVRSGNIAKTRHESFLSMYQDLKDKRPWDNPPSVR